MFFMLTELKSMDVRVASGSERQEINACQDDNKRKIQEAERGERR